MLFGFKITHVASSPPPFFKDNSLFIFLIVPCLHTVIQEGLKKELELLNNQLEECKETHKRELFEELETLEKELLEWKSSRGRFLNKIKVSRMIVICVANGRPELKCWQRRRGSWGDAPENGGTGGGQIGIGKEKSLRKESLRIPTPPRLHCG